MDFTWLFLGTLVLGSWFSAVAAVLPTLTRARIRKLDAEKRRREVEAADYCLANRESLLLTLRLAVFVSLAFFIVSDAAHFGVWLAAEQFGEGFGYAVRVVAGTAVFVVVTELVGRGWLAAEAWWLLRISRRPLQLLHAVFWFIVRPIRALQVLCARPDGGDEETAATTEDEIMSLVEQDKDSQPEQRLEDKERRMIRGIFDLGETLVREIMTPRVDIEALPVTATIAEAKAKIIECGHSRIPVYKDSVDDIVGVIYSKFLLNESRLAEAVSLAEIMAEPVFVPQTKNVAELLEEFRQKKNHLAIISDEYGGTAGIVSIEDILEEIVGDILDEFDSEEDATTPMAHTEDGCIVVDGRMPIDEVNDLLQVAISEDGDYDTIGGYITAELGRIPKPMETAETAEVTVQILEADDRKISRLKLSRVSDNGVNGGLSE